MIAININGILVDLERLLFELLLLLLLAVHVNLNMLTVVMTASSRRLLQQESLPAVHLDRHMGAVRRRRHRRGRVIRRNGQVIASVSRQGKIAGHIAARRAWTGQAVSSTVGATHYREQKVVQLMLRA